MFTSFVAVPLYIKKYHMDINFIVAEVYVNCLTQQKQKNKACSMTRALQQCKHIVQQLTVNVITNKTLKHNTYLQTISFSHDLSL